MNYPHPGIAGSKPRLPKSAENGASGKEEFARLSREYLEIRNRAQSAKAFLAETQAAKQRGELLDRKWVYDSVAYVVTCWRQRCLSAPRTFTTRLVASGLVDAANEHGVLMALDAGMRELLTELANLHLKATNPNWLRDLERKETGATEEDVERRQSPNEHKTAQARAARRAAKKIASHRVRRGHG